VLTLGQIKIRIFLSNFRSNLDQIMVSVEAPSPLQLTHLITVILEGGERMLVTCFQVDTKDLNL